MNDKCQLAVLVRGASQTFDIDEKLEQLMNDGYQYWRRYFGKHNKMEYGKEYENIKAS